MASQDNRRVFKEISTQRRAILVPGAANALTARIIENLAFEAVYVTGAGIANMQFGVPDMGLVTMTELADTVMAIADVVSLPLIVDADTGFGNPLNMTRTIRALERAGASAIQVEDQVFPKRCGHFEGKKVIPQAEMVPKIKAAVDARQDGNLQIIARTDARATEGISAAIDRAAAYVEAGADMVFVEAPSSLEEMTLINQQLSVPQVANMVYGGATPLLTQKELSKLGFSIVLYANAALQASILSMQTVLGALKEDGGIDGVAHLLASFELRQKTVGKGEWDELDARYSG